MGGVPWRSAGYGRSMDKLSLVGSVSSLLCLAGIAWLALGQADLAERLDGLEASVAELEAGAPAPATARERTTRRSTRASTRSRAAPSGSEGTEERGRSAKDRPSRSAVTADDMAADAVAAVDEELDLSSEEAEALTALITEHFQDRGRIQSRLRTGDASDEDVEELRFQFQDDVVDLIGENGLQLVQMQMMSAAGVDSSRKPADGPPPDGDEPEAPGPPPEEGR